MHSRKKRDMTEHTLSPDELKMEIADATDDALGSLRAALGNVLFEENEITADAVNLSEPSQATQHSDDSSPIISTLELQLKTEDTISCAHPDLPEESW